MLEILMDNPYRIAKDTVGQVTFNILRLRRRIFDVLREGGQYIPSECPDDKNLTMTKFDYRLTIEKGSDCTSVEKLDITSYCKGVWIRPGGCYSNRVLSETCGSCCFHGNLKEACLTFQDDSRKVNVRFREKY